MSTNALHRSIDADWEANTSSTGTTSTLQADDISRCIETNSYMSILMNIIATPSRGQIKANSVPLSAELHMLPYLEIV